MLSAARTHISFGEQHGFTLIETLVAMVTGVIVTGALFSILDVSVKQSTKVSDVAQATQLGRTAMTRIQDELHSACVAVKFAPVLEKSGKSKLNFVNSYGEKAEVPATWTTRESIEGGKRKQEFEGVRKDEIEWSKAAETLTDTSTAGSGENAAGEYLFAGTKQTVRIGESIREGGAEGKTPIFQYYKYATSSSAGTATALSTLTAMEPPAEGFTKAEAREVAAVTVTFNSAPLNKKRVEGRTAELTSTSTFAFSAPDAEATISQGPCE